MDAAPCHRWVCCHIYLSGGLETCGYRPHRTRQFARWRAAIAATVISRYGSAPPDRRPPPLPNVLVSPSISACLSVADSRAAGCSSRKSHGGIDPSCTVAASRARRGGCAAFHSEKLSARRPSSTWFCTSQEAGATLEYHGQRVW